MQQNINIKLDVISKQHKFGIFSPGVAITYHFNDSYLYFTEINLMLSGKVFKKYNKFYFTKTIVEKLYT